MSANIRSYAGRTLPEYAETSLSTYSSATVHPSESAELPAVL